MPRRDDAGPRRARSVAKPSAEEEPREVARLKKQVAALKAENALLAAEVAEARRKLDRCQCEGRKLKDKLAQTESESRQVSERVVAVERTTTSFASLYVATERLHGSLDRQEVLVAIQEIITNLLGCEELAVFELDAEGSALLLAASMGIQEAGFARIPLGDGVIGRVALTGEPYLAAPSGGPASAGEGGPPLTACIPLKLGDKVTGVIAIFRLLLQKVGLTESDRELLDLLIPHAAMALHCCTLAAKAQGSVEAVA